jgi:hypothetical protein
MSNSYFSNGERQKSSPPSGHARSFSLEAFQNLFSRQTSSSQYTSDRSRPTSLPSASRSHTAYNHRRSISAESDCDDDLRPDEGWIPIAWDEYIPALPTRGHKRGESAYSSCSGPESSVFDDSDEWTPPSTPASPMFADVPFRSNVEKFVGFDKFGRFRGSDVSTLRWVMCE